jgi:acetyltransferase
MTLLLHVRIISRLSGVKIMTSEVCAEPDAFADAVSTVAPRSGGTLAVRAARPSDEALLEAFYDRVSPEDRRFRFFSAAAHIGHEQLAPLVEGDHFRSECYLALTPDGSLAGTAMLACDKPLDTAEVAISVRADWRGKGLGWALLDLMAGEARRRGVRRIIAIEDRENHAAIELEKEKGFVAHGIDGEPTLVLLEKLLR